MKAKKVLVIDDEQLVLDSVKKILNEGNYEVEATLSGRQGLQWAVEKDYDVVLTDIRMPDIGGMLVLRDVKRAEPSVPVLIITGYGTVRSAVQAMKLGASDYIEKPFSPGDLLKAVETAVETAATMVPPEQALIHEEEIIMVLERAGTDSEFAQNLRYHWADALDEYDLTEAEKLALLTGDIEWIEKYVGPLTETQRRWLEQPLSAQLLRSFGW